MKRVNINGQLYELAYEEPLTFTNLIYDNTQEKYLDVINAELAEQIAAIAGSTSDGIVDVAYVNIDQCTHNYAGKVCRIIYPIDNNGEIESRPVGMMLILESSSPVASSPEYKGGDLTLVVFTDCPIVDVENTNPARNEIDFSDKSFILNIVFRKYDNTHGTGWSNWYYYDDEMFHNVRNQTTIANIAQTTLDPRITLLENELAQYINGGTTVSLKTTPTSIFSNADNNGTNVTLRATASKDASVTITKGGNTIHTAASIQDTSYTDQNVSLAGGQLASYTATFEIGTGTAMVTKTATATVKAYDKIYYGIGTANDHSTVTADQNVRTSVAGTYDFTITVQDIAQGKSYVYILVPTSMSNGNIDLTKVKLSSGFGYNLELLPNTDTKNGVTYKVYRSLEVNNESIRLSIS